MTATVEPRAETATATSSGWMPLVVAVAAMAMLPLGVTGTNLAFADVSAHFAGTSPGLLSFVLSGYSITIAAFTLLGGQLSDRLGSRRMFFGGIAGFAVAGAVAGAAPAALVLIAARVVQGAAGALIVPSSLAMALARLTPDRHPTAIGVWTAAFPIGSSLAPTLAALVLDAGGWRWVFLAPVPVAVVLLATSLGRGPGDTAAPSASAAPPPIDLVGLVLGTGAVGLLALGIAQGPRWGWAGPATLGCLAAAAALAPVVVRRAHRSAQPLVPVELFSVPTFRLANLANVPTSMAGTAVWLLWPLQMRRVWRYDQLTVGLAMTPTPALGGAVAILTARWAHRRGYRLPLVAGTCGVVLACAWFAVAIGERADYWGGMFPGLVLFGVSMGLVFAPLNGAALVDVPQASIGRANAAFNTGRFLSGAIGIALMVAALGTGDDAHPNDAFDRGYLLLAAISVPAAVLLAVRWPRRAERTAA